MEFFYGGKGPDLIYKESSKNRGHISAGLDCMGIRHLGWGKSVQGMQLAVKDMDVIKSRQEEIAAASWEVAAMT